MHKLLEHGYVQEHVFMCFMLVCYLSSMIIFFPYSFAESCDYELELAIVEIAWQWLLFLCFVNKHGWFNIFLVYKHIVSKPIFSRLFSYNNNFLRIASSLILIRRGNKFLFSYSYHISIMIDHLGYFSFNFLPFFLFKYIYVHISQSASLILSIILIS